MRVLWFSTNCCLYEPIKIIKGDGYNGGGWMTSVQNEIMKREDITLAVSFCMDGQPEKVVKDGVCYYPVSHHTKKLKDKVLDIIHYKDKTRDEVLWQHYIEHFKRVIEDFKPDVIEVFGSELYLGLSALAAKELGIPCCLHLQGLLSLSLYIYLVPGVSRWSYIFSKGWRRAYDMFQLLTYWQRSCHREKAILRSVGHVLGRTDWDRQALAVLNPEAIYHLGGEILRPCFYFSSTRSLPSILTITTTISAAPYKGLDLLLKIARILKEEIHLDFVWNCYGNVDSSFAERVTGIRHEDVNVRLCGVASAEELCDALRCSTLYCHTSYIENSPNSIAEAQILGLPVVATNVGGTSSMVEHGETGFLFPATDPYIAAYHIMRLASDKDLNVRMGETAKVIAMARHDKQKIVSSLLETYKSIMDK